MSCGRNLEQHTGSDPYPIQSVWKEKTVSGTPRSETPDLEGVNDSKEEIALASNMRRVLTRLQERKMASPGGGSSAISRVASHSKDEAASKKHCTT